MLKVSRLSCLVFFTVLILLILSGSPVAAESTAVLSYDVQIRPGEFGQVEANLSGAGSLPDVVVFSMEEISGLNVDFLGNTFNISAQGPEGQILDVYEESYGWNIHTEGHAEITVYYYFGSDLVEVGGMERNFIRIMDSEGLFVNQAIFALPNIDFDEVYVEYDLPAGWQAATHFTPLGDNRFKVEGSPDWHTDMLANVTRIGTVLHQVEKEIAGITYTFYVFDSVYENRGLVEFWEPDYGTTPEVEMEAYIDLTAASVGSLSDVFGFWPGGNRYIITTKVTDHDELHSIVGFKYWMQAWTRERHPDVPHHVAHAWIWREPINLQAAEHDLIMEGMPTYYQAALMREITGEERWLGLHYIHYLILERAWQFGLENKRTVKVYAQSHMQILALNDFIKEHSGGQKDINDLMAYLGQNFGLAGEPFSREEFKVAIESVSGADSAVVDNFYTSYLAGEVASEFPPVAGLIDSYREPFFQWLDTYDAYPEEAASGNRTMILIAMEIGLHTSEGFPSEHIIAGRAGLYDLNEFRQKISEREPISEQDVIAVLSDITGVDQADFFTFYQVGDFQPSVAEVEQWLGLEAESDFHLWLDQGWNLVSVPRWTENIDIEDADIEAWLTFLDGRWTSEGVESELANPAQAVFIKAKQPTMLGFKWKEMRPEYEFAGQELTEGWNLISCGRQADYETILAHERYDGSKGLTQAYAPNAFNGRKDNDYFMPWYNQLISLINPDQQAMEVVYPLDGYWVYLKGGPVVFSTPVSDRPVEPVREAPVYRIEADPGKGFNFAYYLFIPEDIYDNPGTHLMVGPNNTGTQHDDPQVHDESAYNQAANSWKTIIANELGTPMLVPTFPRPRDDWYGYDWRHYTHALNRAALMIDDGGPLERIDLQLIAMIEDARVRLADMDIFVEDKVFMNGYSACGQFSNRFTILHPHLIKAVAAGGVGAIPTFPTEEWSEETLRYPVGIADIGTIAGINFNLETYRQVPQYIYMGSEDDNDPTQYRDSFEEEDAVLIWDLFGQDMSVRWANSIQVYDQLGINNAQFVTYEGIGHELNEQIINDVIEFFRAHSNWDMQPTFTVEWEQNGVYGHN